MPADPVALLPPESVTHYLTTFFAEHLPISNYLGMRIHQYTGDTFTLAIDLAPSINDKLTAFGGSIYTVCVMNCWGMCYLQARQRGINPNIVVRHGDIDYVAPVDDEVIVASCNVVDEGDWQTFFDSFAANGRARVSLTSTIISRGKKAAKFQGQYAMIGVVN